MSESDKKEYEVKATELKSEHQKMYPHYKYRPKRRPPKAGNSKIPNSSNNQRNLDTSLPKPNSKNSKSKTKTNDQGFPPFPALLSSNLTYQNNSTSCQFETPWGQNCPVEQDVNFSHEPVNELHSFGYPGFQEMNPDLTGSHAAWVQPGFEQPAMVDLDQQHTTTMLPDVIPNQIQNQISETVTCNNDCQINQYSNQVITNDKRTLCEPQYEQTSDSSIYGPGVMQNHIMR